MKIALLGTGMVGRAIAVDLSAKFRVTGFDISIENLRKLELANPEVETRQANLQDFEQYSRLLEPFDLVVTAVPGFMGYRTIEAVVHSGKNAADISFFPENALHLQPLAVEKGVTVITDIGVAPGMSNLLLGRASREMKVNRFQCYVGGLPRVRKKPFEYKAPFSPIDVLEEYTRPARLKERGIIVTKPALSDRELLEFEGIGTLEAFNTDGLRSLLETMKDIPEMAEKTLRYPGHADLIEFLQNAGFFNREKILVNGTLVSPMEITAKVLMNEWKLDEEEEEITVMKVIMDGEENGKNKKIEYDLLDYFDPKTKTSSMARTTGYTCSAAVNLIASGIFSEKGVFPPENIGMHKASFDFVLNYLAERGVHYLRKESFDASQA